MRFRLNFTPQKNYKTHKSNKLLVLRAIVPECPPSRSAQQKEKNAVGGGDSRLRRNHTVTLTDIHTMYNSEHILPPKPSPSTSHRYFEYQRVGRRKRFVTTSSSQRATYFYSPADDPERRSFYCCRDLRKCYEISPNILHIVERDVVSVVALYFDTGFSDFLVVSVKQILLYSAITDMT